MAQKKIYLGQQLQHSQRHAASGQYVDLDGETYYQIADYDQMKDFFISVVSDSNHWMFISSRGGLSAGRVNSANALFPYYSDDKINDGSSHTGSRTITLVTKDGKTSLWEPFSSAYAGIYQTSRNLYKNVYGDKLVFEEVSVRVVRKLQWKSYESKQRKSSDKMVELVKDFVSPRSDAAFIPVGHP